MQSLRPTP